MGQYRRHDNYSKRPSYPQNEWTDNPRYYGGNYRQQYTKKSGASWTQESKNGNPCISAWKASRRDGLTSILIAPYKHTKIVESKNGRKWHVWMCNIRQGINENHFPVLVDVQKQMCVIDKLGWVVNCKAKNGGYCGTFSNY
jgi:hypothetical protein